MLDYSAPTAEEDHYHIYLSRLINKLYCFINEEDRWFVVAVEEESRVSQQQNILQGYQQNSE